MLMVLRFYLISNLQTNTRTNITFILQFFGKRYYSDYNSIMVPDTWLSFKFNFRQQLKASSQKEQLNETRIFHENGR